MILWFSWLSSLKGGELFQRRTLCYFLVNPPLILIPQQLRIIPKKVYLFLLPGCVNIFDLKKTSEVEKPEPLPLTLEVGGTTVRGAAHPSYAGSEQWAEGR